MLSKIQIYVLKHFIKFVLGTSVLSIFLFVVFDFMHESQGFSENSKVPIASFLEIYLYQIPTLLFQTLPIAALLGSVSTMILLNRSNEVTAMRSFGMSALDIARPLILGGVVLSLLSFYISEYAQPYAAKKAYAKKREMRGKTGAKENGFGWIKQDNRFLNFDRYNPQNRELSGISIYELNKNFQISRIIYADHGVLVAEPSSWKLSSVELVYLTTGSFVSGQESRKEMALNFHLPKEKLANDFRASSEKSLKELSEIIQSGRLAGQNVIEEVVDYHNKIAFCFAPLVIVFLGLRFGYKSGRKAETVKGILFALAIGAGYWVVFSSFRVLAKQENMSPMLAAWMANIIVAAIIFIDFRQSKEI